MDRIQDLIKRASKSHNLSGEMEAAFVLQKTMEIIRDYWGEKGVKNLKPQKISFNQLYIKVPNSAWAQEIQLRKHEIIKRLNEEKIKNILELRIVI